MRVPAGSVLLHQAHTLGFSRPTGDGVVSLPDSIVGSFLQACCLQLKAKISRAQSAKEQESRKRNLTRYIPDVTSSIIKVRVHPQDSHTGECCAAVAVPTSRTVF